MGHLHVNNNWNHSEFFSEFGILPPDVQGGYTNPLRPFDQLMVENGDIPTQNEEYNSFEKFPVRTTCKTCNLRVTTNVDKKLGTDGWWWVICCCLACFGGGWFLGLLVLCVDTFWKFNHYCPRCSSKLATYSPEASCRICTIKTIIVISVIALNVLIGWYFATLIHFYYSVHRQRYY